jgi:ABC-type transporter MlaC component
LVATIVVTDDDIADGDGVAVDGTFTWSKAAHDWQGPWSVWAWPSVGTVGAAAGNQQTITAPLDSSITSLYDWWRTRLIGTVSCGPTIVLSGTNYASNSPVSIGNYPPVNPESVSITPANPKSNSDLTASAVDGDGNPVLPGKQPPDPEGSPIVYEFEWQKSTDGVTWSANWTSYGIGEKLGKEHTKKGEFWRVRARAYDLPGGVKGNYGPWTEIDASAAVYVDDSPPTAPASVTFAPLNPTSADNITGTAAGSTDDDGDAITYEYQWSKAPYTDWITTDVNPNILQSNNTIKGETWKVRARAKAANVYSPWTESAVITIVNGKPFVPTAVALSPSSANHPNTDEIISATVTKKTPQEDPDGDVVTTEYQWSRRPLGGDWMSWMTEINATNIGAQLGNTPEELAATIRGDQWRVRVRSNDGTDVSDWLVSTAVTIADRKPNAPTNVTIGPAATVNKGTALTYTVTPANATDPDGTDDADVLYEIEWTNDGGATWILGQGAGGALAGSQTNQGGKTWRARVRAKSPSAPAGNDTSDPVESTNTILVQNQNPNQPAAVDLTPANPLTATNLVATVTAANPVDPDASDTVVYDYAWQKKIGPGVDDWATQVTHAGVSDTTDTLAGGTAKKDEEWRVQVTARDGDGGSSTPRNSASVVIDDTAPNTPVGVTITPANPFADDNLNANVTAAVPTDVDGDVVTYEYRWQQLVGGNWTPALDEAPYTGPVGSPLLPGTVANGETWRVSVRAKSGAPELVSGWQSSAGKTIGDKPPAAPTVTVTPASPVTGNDLTGTITPGAAPEDPDGQPVSYDYTWERDGVAMQKGVVASNAPGNVTLTVDKGDTKKNEQWQLKVIAKSGVPEQDSAEAASNVVTIGNTAPSGVAVTVTPPFPSTASTLQALGTATDPDRTDGVDALVFQYAWRVSTNAGGTWGAWQNQSVAIADGTSNTLLIGELNNGDWWQSRVRVSDRHLSPYDWGAWVDSNVVVIGNTAPTAPVTVTLTPNPAFTIDDLQALAAGSTDVETAANQLQYEYEWAMSADGGATFGAWGNSSGLLADGVAAVLPNALTAKGQQWKARARGWDGADFSPWTQSAVRVIGDSPPSDPVVVLAWAGGGEPTTDKDLVATITPSVDGDGDVISYDFTWTRDGADVDHGTTTNTTLTMPHSQTKVGEVWQVKVQAGSGAPELTSAEVASNTVTIANTAPTVPTLVINPAAPDAFVDLVATGTSTDPDVVEGAQLLVYTYQWSKSVNGGVTWGAWYSPVGDSSTVPEADTAQSERWRVRARVTDGTATTAWSPAPYTQVVIGNAAPNAPAAAVVNFVGGGPFRGTELTAGYTAAVPADPDGDAVTYEYNWQKSTDAGTTWADTGLTGDSVPAGTTVKGEWWRVQVRANDGELSGPYTNSPHVVIQDTPPTAPNLAIGPAGPLTTDDLLATVNGSTDADGDAITYTVEWSKDGGMTWPETGETLDSSKTARGETWQAQARATAGGLDSTWTPSAGGLIIANTPPTNPTSVSMNWAGQPAQPNTNTDINAAASGSTDADAADVVTYEFQWSKDGGATWPEAGATLTADKTAPGETWQLRGRATDGTNRSGWVAGGTVTIASNSAPTAPTTVTIAPAAPFTDQDLTATAAGSTDLDGDPIEYEYQWAKSTDGGVTFGAWGNDGNLLDDSKTSRGNVWKAQGRAKSRPVGSTDEGDWQYSNWTQSAAVSIADKRPTVPTAINLSTPRHTGINIDGTATGSVDADGDAISYHYQWSKDGGATWGFAAVQPAGTPATLDQAQTVRGQNWRVRARAEANGLNSAWFTTPDFEIENALPTAPTQVDVDNLTPLTGDDLTATATGSTDPIDGDAITGYEYEWSKDGFVTVVAGATLPNAQTKKGEVWQARARAVDALGGQGPWTLSAAVTIGNTVPTAAAAAAIAPDPAVTTDNLVVVPGGSVDPDVADGIDTLTYEVEWSNDGGATWPLNGATLPAAQTSKGQTWQAQVRATDGTTPGPWTASANQVVIGDTAPTAPTAPVITPATPLTSDDLTATTNGSTDADGEAITYTIEWSKDAFVTIITGDTLPAVNTAKGEVWQARAKAMAGGVDSGWSPVSQVTIGNTAPTAATSLLLTPANPNAGANLQALAAGGADVDGDALQYEYEWSKDGGATWGHLSVHNAGTPAVLDSANTSVGETWQARARAFDGAAFSDYKAGDNTLTVVGNSPPTAPTNVAVTPLPAYTDTDLTATAAGSTDLDGDPLSYEYQWAKSTDGGATFGAWGNDGNLLDDSKTLRAEVWKARARAYDGAQYGDWTESEPFTIQDKAPSRPSVVTLSPNDPGTGDDLQAFAVGSTDADGDPIAYEYQWSKSTDGGVTFGAWGWAGQTLAKNNTSLGEQWKARARATANGLSSTWRESAATTIINSAPTAPTSVTLAPASPTSAQDVTATATGSVDDDGEEITYEYEWSKSTDGGATWSAWGLAGNPLDNAQTVRADQWKARARAKSGDPAAYSEWVESFVITIRNAAPTTPATVTVTPAEPFAVDNLQATASACTDPDGDPVSYSYQWRKSLDGGTTWSAWGWGSTTGVLNSTNTTRGELWQARARATDGTNPSAWTESAAVEIKNQPPTPPTGIIVTPANPADGDNLTATASGGTDPDGDPVVYQYEWSKDSGLNWGFTGNGTLDNANTAEGDRWQARARSFDGAVYSAWFEVSNTVTIGNRAPNDPAGVNITPLTPTTLEDLTAAVVPATPVDPDGDPVTYDYEWRVSNDGGVTWSAWGNAGQTLGKALTFKGQQWMAHVRADDGRLQSNWVESAAVTIINAAPTAPTTVTVGPGNPTTTNNLTAVASGSTDPDGGDVISYEFEWSKSIDGGTTWSDWGWAGATLPSANTAKGEQWKARARAFDNGAPVGRSVWVESAATTILNSPPALPTSLTLAPATPTTSDNLTATVVKAAPEDVDGDTITYEFAWSKDGGTTWPEAGTTVGDVNTLDAAVTNRGDVWMARVRANDGVTQSAWRVAPTSLTIGNSTPAIPTNVVIAPLAPKTTDDLYATAGGSVDLDGDDVLYVYQWSVRDGLGIWGPWQPAAATTNNAWPSASTLKGQSWKVRAAATDGFATSGYKESTPVQIVDQEPTDPVLTVNPAAPLTDDTVVATAAGSTDPDGDPVSFEYRWSNDGGATWPIAGDTLAAAQTTKGQVWTVGARAKSGPLGGEQFSNWVTIEVTIGNTPPTDPTLVQIAPVNPDRTMNLNANAAGSTDADGDPIVGYQFEWAQSTDDGATWGPWGNAGAVLPAANLARGDMWKVRGRANDGTDTSNWVESAPVTVVNAPPSAPADLTIAPAAPFTTDSLVAAANGSVDPDGDALVGYEIQWARSNDGGATWGAWGFAGDTLDSSNTARGQWWKARARNSDGLLNGAWLESAPVVIQNTAPTAPASVVITPATPGDGDDLTATAAGATDADGDALQPYEYQWRQSTDGGVTWGAWGFDGNVLGAGNTNRGDRWQARARVSDGTDFGPWLQSAVVIIANTSPTAPTTVTIAPAAPFTTDNLVATAAGSTDADGDALTYNYQWRRSLDGGTTWGAWGSAGDTLLAAQTARGEMWMARGRANDGTVNSGWTESLPVTIQNSVPTDPTTVAITPAAPHFTSNLAVTVTGATDADNDPLTYDYQWSKWEVATSTWGAWGFDNENPLSAANTTLGDQWKVRARAKDGVGGLSNWVESAPVTVVNTPPTEPTEVTIAPATPLTTNNLVATATGSTDADGDAITYAYEWARSLDDGATWEAWGNAGQTLDASLTTRGEQWKARAKANDGTSDSGWTESAPVVIGNSVPTAPTSVVVTPSPAGAAEDLTATPEGSVDNDGEAVNYEIEWARSTDGGATWEAWGNAGAVLSQDQTAAGERWKARARATDGTDFSNWVESAPVTISNTLPTDPTSVTITPATPRTVDNLVAEALGATDPDGQPVVYEYEWAFSNDGGANWSAWAAGGNTLGHAVTAAGQQWRARARAFDGTDRSGWLQSAPVTISGDSIAVPSDFATIQAAIDASNNGETVEVSAGAYNENITFRGKAITVRSTEPANPNVVANTIINGGGLGTVVTFNSGEPATAVLAGFTITNGQAADGGGIALTNDSSPTITNNVITGNVAAQDGGGIYYYRSASLITQNVIVGNSARRGAGICAAFDGVAAPVISRNVINANNAVVGGGGIFIHTTAVPAVRNNVITNNTSENGGGLYVSSSPALVNNTISGNSATQYGGGVLCYYSSPVLTNNIITFSPSGSGIYVSSGNPLITYCNVFGNAPADYRQFPDQTGTAGNISVDPLFANPAAGNFYLKSGGGRFHPPTGNWINDAVHSPCIDAGDPAAAFGQEPAPNGGRVNMGAYGNTPQASKSLPPVVLATNPTNGTLNFAPNKPVLIRFNQPMWKATVENYLSFVVDDGSGTAVPYTTQWFGTMAVKLIPQGFLTPDTAYEVKVGGNARSSSKLYLGQDFVLKFRTSESLVQSSTPAVGEVYNRNLAIAVNFRWRVVQGSAENFFSLQDSTKAKVGGTFTWPAAQRKVVFTPDKPLKANEVYTVQFNRGVRLADGTVISWPESFNFTTADTPAVINHAPRGDAVPVGTKIKVFFDQRMHIASAESNFVVTPATPGTFVWENARATLVFTPDSPLQADTLYTVRVNGAARSAAGVRLDVPFEWSFSTGLAAGKVSTSTALVTTASAGPAVNGISAITVNVSAAAAVQVQIRNIAGREVAVLPLQDVPVGVTTLLWDGKGRTGTLVPGGQYLATVQACTTGGAKSHCLVTLQR